MTKNEFMTMLHDLLKEIPANERQDILYDYEEHFQIALAEGKSEAEITALLGHPKTITKELKANYHSNRAQTEPSVENIGRAIIATIALGFFNLVIVLGPFVGLLGVLVGLFGAALGLIVMPIGILLRFSFPTSPLDILHMFFVLITSGSLGVLMGIGLIYVSKWIFQGFLKYLQFNIRVIRGK